MNYQQRQKKLNGQNKRMKRIAVISLAVILMIIPIMGVSCDSDEVSEDDFGIYLVAEDIPSSQIASFDFNAVELQDDPFISIDDIITYSWDTHEIKLTEESGDRTSSLRPPVTGTPSVVCVGTECVYSGALWPTYSSVLLEGATTIDPLLAGMRDTIQISVGPLYSGEDPRSDSRIFDSLKHADKLINYQ